MPTPLAHSRDTAWDFAPEFVKAQERPPSPLPRALLYLLLGLLVAMLAWAFLGRLDMVAVAQGRLVPQSFLKIVQPAESGIVREILVQEGEIVAAGQVLVRMDTQLSQADLKAVEAELVRRDLQLRRIDAELAGTALSRKAVDPADQFTQVEAQRKARRQAYVDALGAEQAVLMKARQDLQSAIEVEQKLTRTLPIYREQAHAWDKLANEGFAGKLMALDRQRGYVEAEQDLEAQKHTVEGLKATIAQAEKRIAQIESGYRQQLHQERLHTPIC